MTAALKTVPIEVDTAPASIAENGFGRDADLAGEVGGSPPALVPRDADLHAQRPSSVEHLGLRNDGALGHRSSNKRTL
jgi:hypothetical protein